MAKPDFKLIKKFNNVDIDGKLILSFGSMKNSLKCEQVLSGLRAFIRLIKQTAQWYRVDL